MDGRRLLALALVLALPACAASATPRLERMYERSLARPGDAAEREALAALERERMGWIEEVRAMHARGALKRERDLLIAATLLLDSPDVADLDLARDLALAAAERGDERGFPLAAEAIDRALMLRGEPQRYGTQYVSVPGYGWVLYRWDPATTDAERASMGVPPLAEALERLKTLNGADRPSGSAVDR
jgi:hypothetical protein